MLKMGYAGRFLMLIWMPLFTASHQTQLEQAIVRPVTLHVNYNNVIEEDVLVSFSTVMMYKTLYLLFRTT